MQPQHVQRIAAMSTYCVQFCLQGLVTESPIFSQQPRLPTLVGQFVYTFGLFRYLTRVYNPCLLCMFQRSKGNGASKLRNHQNLFEGFIEVVPVIYDNMYGHVWL